MITTAIIYVISLLIGVLGFLLPSFQIWPDSVFEAFDYFITNLTDLSVLFIFIPTIFTALIFFIKFLTYYLTFRISVKIFNYLRGVGAGLE